MASVVPLNMHPYMKVFLMPDADNTSHQRFFSLEDATSLLQELSGKVEDAQHEIHTLHSHLILQKRLVVQREKALGRYPSEEELMLIAKSGLKLESCIEYWVTYFERQGVLLRDPKMGLIDFPYKSETTDEVFFLSWCLEDEGLFYFHTADEPPHYRHPISLLPA